MKHGPSPCHYIINTWNTTWQ